MSEKASEKYEKVQSKIEKIISPYITLRIPMPEGVDKEAFLKLENDSRFIESLKKQVKKWLTRETGH
ncbi:MAG: hypothetical protein ACE5R6_21205 [Candidatus Heimdallarchaeota archaeon]